MISIFNLMIAQKRDKSTSLPWATGQADCHCLQDLFQEGRKDDIMMGKDLLYSG